MLIAFAFVTDVNLKNKTATILIGRKDMRTVPIIVRSPTHVVVVGGDENCAGIVYGESARKIYPATIELVKKDTTWKCYFYCSENNPLTKANRHKKRLIGWYTPNEKPSFDTIQEIAKQHLAIDKLKITGVDHKDVVDVHVSQITSALDAMYQAGYKHGLKRRVS